MTIHFDKKGWTIKQENETTIYLIEYEREDEKGNWQEFTEIEDEIFITKHIIRKLEYYEK